MKILYHHRIASKDGQYVHIEELTNALRALGHDIIMAGPSMIDEGDFGGESKLVELLKRRIPGPVYELMEFSYSLRDYFMLARMIKRHRPDIIYERYNLYLPSGVWAARRFDLPLIVEVNAPLHEERSRYNGLALPKLAKRTERYVWRGADKVIAVTQVLAERIQREQVPREKIAVMSNGINMQRFSAKLSPEEAKKRLNLQGRLVLGFVGFARAWHGLDRVIDLIAEETEESLHFLLVGDGSICNELQARARAAGVEEQMSVTGVVGREEVANYIKAFDIALQPSVVEYASPLKLFEYMSAGCGVVAPDSANIREILVHEQNSLLFSPQAPGAFTSAVKRLCKDVELRQRLGSEAQATLRKRDLTWAGNAQKVEVIARQLQARTALA